MMLGISKEKAVTKLTIALAVLTMALVACNENKKPNPAMPTNPTVTEIAPPAAPAPVAAQPVYEPAPAVSATPAPATATPASSNYTVKKGDTLYSIAKSRYGDGKQFTRIVAANPGVTPQNLKVGQTLVLP